MIDPVRVLGHPLVTRLTRSAAVGRLANPSGNVADSKLRAAVSGRTVLVTGASYGLGEATARRLGLAGATVLLVARTEEALSETARSIQHAGGTAHAYRADLSDPDQVGTLATQILEQHGYVDVLINNAGKSIRRSVAAAANRFHDYERTIGVNYLGPVRLVLALLPAMRERGHGHLINISTVGVQIPPGPRWSAYQASKSAFDVFFRSAAAEARADGISATSVYMTLVYTRMSAPTRSLQHAPGLTPDEAAALVCKAVVDRPSKISPWWAGLAAVGFSATRTPWEFIVSQMYRLGRTQAHLPTGALGGRSDKEAS